MKKQRPRSPIRTAVLAAASAMTGVACDQAADLSPTESVAAPISDVGEAVCALVNASDRFDINLGTGKFTIDTECRIDRTDRLHYFGSAPALTSPRGSPRREAEALYCTTAGLDGATADATSDGALGTFGIQSRVRIYRKDPAALRLSGERVGKIYAFGVGLDLEQQELEWSFPTELGPRGGGVLGGVLRQAGQYGILQTAAPAWRINGEGSVPLSPGGPRLFFTLRFGSNGAMGALDKDVIAASPTPAPFPTPYNSYQAHLDECNRCLAAPLPPGTIRVCSTCPSLKEQADHAFTCGGGGCTADVFRNLGDRILPYRGDLGATGPFIARGQRNWWHVGYPGTAAAAATIPAITGFPGVEPVYSLAPGGTRATTTDFFFSVGLGWDVGVAAIQGDVETTIGFRNGVALRQQMAQRDPDGRAPPLVQTWSALDAQSSIAVIAHFRLWLDLPFLDNPVIDATFDLYRPHPRQSTDNTSSAAFWDPNSRNEPGVRSYTVRGVNQPDGFSSCLNVPPVVSPPTMVANPRSFVEEVGKKAQDSVHPCNVVLCTIEGGAPQRRTCTWNAATKSLSCTVVPGGCSCQSNYFELCDNAGNVYRPSRPPTVSCPPIVN